MRLYQINIRQRYYLMKTGCLIIDNIDVYTEYGIYVVEGGWKELVSFPPLKTVKFNDWQEEDGIEADLSAPVLNTREVTIKFAISNGEDRHFDFLNLLAGGAYHTFECTEIGRTFRLRLVSHASLDLASRLGFLSVKFADDFPLYNYLYQSPVPTGVQDCGYAIDGTALSDYGVRVLEGLSEVRKGSAVKQAMLRNIPSQGGVIYDEGGSVTYKSKDVKLNCLLRANNLSDMWRNYYALLYDLVQPSERMLHVSALDSDFPCMYKSCSVKDFSPIGKVWLEFTLTLTFTRGIRTEVYVGLLDSENSHFVETESGELVEIRRMNKSVNNQ